MTDIEEKALALINEILKERRIGGDCDTIYRATDATDEALCRAIEQHEAFRQKVSDAVIAFMMDKPGLSGSGITHFIIPAKPDPLVRVINEVIYEQPHGDIDEVRMAGDFRAALDALGFEIREKSK